MKKLVLELKLVCRNEQWYFDEPSSDRFAEITGFSIQQIQNEYFSCFLSFFSADDAAIIKQHFQELKENETVLLPQLFSLKHADHHQIPIRLWAAFEIPSTSGQQKQLCITLLDVTELENDYVTLKNHTNALEQVASCGFCKLRLDYDLTVLWNNQSFLQLLGYTEEQFQEELCGCVRALVHPDDEFFLTNRLDGLLKNPGAIADTELRVIRRDGITRTLSLRCFCSKRNPHEIPFLYLSIYDITEKKRAMELEWDAKRFQIAISQTSSCVWEYDIPRRKLINSESLRELMGLQKDLENVPESVINLEIVHRESVTPFLRIFDDMICGKEKTEGVVQLRKHDGTFIWAKISMSCVLDKMGNPHKAVALMEDITERYNLELRYREEENRRSAMTYDQIFACRLNLSENKILEANTMIFPSYREELNRVSTLIHQNARNFVHPEDQELYMQTFERGNLITNFRNNIPELNLEYRILNEEGTYIWLQATMHTIREPSKGELWTYVYIKNIDQQKRTELELRRHAEIDGLTELYNRHTTEMKCRELLKNRKPDILCAMLSLDLDGFKNINDTYGHSSGDEFLKQIASILVEMLKQKQSVIGRLGGDEFLAFLPDCQSADAVKEQAQQICDEISARFQEIYGVSVSVGISMAPYDGLDYDTLYQCADTALYKAKGLGKNRCILYDKSMPVNSGSAKSTVSREWLLDEANDLIYVADLYNHELLYLNSNMKNLFHQDDNYKGEKCYKILQGIDRPCDFCTNHLLSRDKFYHWKYFNPLIGQSLIVKDRIVDWYGRPARIEFATNVTEVTNRSRILEQQVQIDETIIECFRAFDSGNTFEKALELSLQSVGELYQADRVFILKYDGPDSLKLHYIWMKNNVSYPNIPEEGWELISRILRACSNGMCYRMNDPSLLREENPELCRLYLCNNIDCQRIIPFFQEGQMTGFIGMDNPLVLREEITALETLGYCVAEELTKRELSSKLNFLDACDRLTGLKNRNSFSSYLSSLNVRPLKSLGLVIADLNSLGEINRTQGFEEGDRAVKSVAFQFKTFFPEGPVFRLSGDEFLAVFENCEEAHLLSRLNCLNEEFQKDSYGVSIGYAWSGKKNDFSQLINQAREMMLMRKQTYYQKLPLTPLWSKHGHSQIRPLLDAIRKREFQVYLQPKVNCTTGTVTGAEALARYDSPEHGFYMPSYFIPELERTYTIKYLDLFILEEVCRILDRWKREKRRIFPISLNLSRLTLLEPGILQTIQKIVDDFHIPHSLIELEITESLGIYADQMIADIGSGIQKAGFRLSLDDFGSQYTNMSILAKLPPDTLKVDRSLVRDLPGNQPNKILLQYLLAFCKEMKIQSVIEGVENQEQHTLLKTLGCDEIQGFLFGKPMPVKDFELLYK